MILKLGRDDSGREIDFELKFLRSLSIKQRFALMARKNREMLRLLEKNEHRRAFEIIKRT